MARGKNTADHPKRQVGKDYFPNGRYNNFSAALDARDRDYAEAAKTDAPAYKGRAGIRTR